MPSYNCLKKFLKKPTSNSTIFNIKIPHIPQIVPQKSCNNSPYSSATFYIYIAYLEI